MGTQNNRNWLQDNPLIVLIGLIASCIGIFVFVTGIENIRQMLQIVPHAITTETPLTYLQIPSPTPTQPQVIAGQWTKVGLWEDTVSDIVIVAPGLIYASTYGYNHGIFKSNTSGQSWKAVNNGLGNLEIYGIDALDADTVIAATEMGLYITRNGGQSWRPAGPTDLQDLTMLDVAFLQQSSPYIYAVGAANYGAFVSRDWGSTWKNVEYEGLFWNVSLQHVATGTNPSPTIYLTGYGEVYRSSNGGQSWLRVANVGANYDIADIEVDPTDSNTVYVCTGSREFSGYYGISVDPGNGLYKSQDGGGSWEPINNGLPNQGHETECSSVYVDRTNNQNVYVGMNGQVFVSNDGGMSWVQLSRLPQDIETVTALAVDGINRRVCIGTNKQGVWCIAY